MTESIKPIDTDRLTFDLDTYTKVIGKKEGERIVLYQLAGAGSRISAVAIDVVVLTLFYLLFAGVVYAVNPEWYDKANAPQFLLYLFLEWIIIYFMFFESFTRGTTCGKRILGIRTVSKHPDKKLNGVHYVLRNIARIADFLPVFGIGGAVMIMTTPARQRIGDFLAGSIVVYNVPLMYQLKRAGVSSQLYSTSMDGYYIEGLLERLKELSPGARIHLSKAIAQYLREKYGETHPDADLAYRQERYVDYLYQLLINR